MLVRRAAIGFRGYPLNPRVGHTRAMWSTHFGCPCQERKRRRGSFQERFCPAGHGLNACKLSKDAMSVRRDTVWKLDVQMRIVGALLRGRELFGVRQENSDLDTSGREVKKLVTFFVEFVLLRQQELQSVRLVRSSVACMLHVLPIELDLELALDQGDAEDGGFAF